MFVGSTGRLRTFCVVERDVTATGGAGTDAVLDRARPREKSAQQEACTSSELAGGAGVD
ncbi:hypothetical protein PAXRUDRAFT_21200 [Paxillus rubicundulus Ve08.2h10]|uniref:Uncharacterized protein n=1 Tax=Paxillus rubicundulus Ve08.2h10 TaxID=930991 RepID=A0A0D0D7V8_9AGAM|nr:hypothetical protein PAXRUDRAFT_21200 [Paxillus rubicundulus Ve08.2h10]